MLLLFLKWLAFISAAILFVVLIGFQLYKSYLRSSTKIETPNGISSLEEITLGGNRQWIFIRGTDKNNPVLLLVNLLWAWQVPALLMPASLTILLLYIGTNLVQANHTIMIFQFNQCELNIGLKIVMN